MEIANKVKEIYSKLNSDIAELEAKAESLNLYLRYDNKESELSKRINDEWVLYPRFHSRGLHGVGVSNLIEQVTNLINKTDDNVKSNTTSTFKLLKSNQVKVTSFHYLHDLRVHLNEVTDFDYPYMSGNDREGHNDFLVKKFQNGNAIYQLTEEQYNYIKNIIES